MIDETNRLYEMLASQWALQFNSFGIDPLEIEGEARTEFIRWNVLALTDELHEMLNEVGWKPWATSNHVNEDAALGELIDAWHFMLNLLLAIVPRGADKEQIADAFTARYFKKKARNEARQEEGLYDGVSGKCPACWRSFDDIPPIVNEQAGGTASCGGCGVYLEELS